MKNVARAIHAECKDLNINPENYLVDTGRKLNVHKTLRRRPGRLLKFLCTFNLRPVSTKYDTHLSLDKLYCMKNAKIRT